MPEFRLPNVNSRVSIMGMTGTGKTLFGAWLFSFSDFSKRPYVIIDYKRDQFVERIEHIREIDLNTVPKHPGLYVIRPRPDQFDAMEKWLWSVWRKGKIGLFVDEGYMLKNSQALVSILTQGRSLKIPCMTLTQRPTYCSRFVFSESNYFAAFHLNDKRDWDTVNSFAPLDRNIPLLEHQCQWYDVSQKLATIINPVPGEDELLEIYRAALGRKTRGI